MRLLLLADIQSEHTEKWALGLAANGIEVGLFSFNKATYPWYENIINITLLYEAEIKLDADNIINKLFYFKFVKLLKTAIKKFTPDVLHAHYATSYGLIGALSGFHPFVISAWGTDVMRFPQKNFINKFINRNPTRKKEIAYHDKLANAATVATMASTAENTPEKESVRQNHLVAKLHNEQVIKPADPRQLVENAAFLKANSIFANDTLENLLRNIVVKLQRIQLIDAMDTIRHDSIYQEYVKQKLQTQDVDVAKQPPNIGENKMTGGYELNKIKNKYNLNY